MNNNKINGIDVSECNFRFNHFEKNICELGNRKLGELHYLCSENQNCYFKKLKRLQEENEKIKKQYNCYACGNCNGKEDYINLEKHHKGLRKRFDELVKRNNTLSLRIEELEKENEKLKEKIKSEKYIKENALQEATKYSMKCGEFRQALKEIRSYCDEQNLKEDYTACYITNMIDEVLNEQK